MVGLRRAFPSALVKAAFVTGLGDVRLYVDSRDPAGASRRWAIAAATSARWIHAIHWRPLPSRPPTPSRNGGSMVARAPPCGESTTPIRREAVSIPQSRAGARGGVFPLPRTPRRGSRVRRRRLRQALRRRAPRSSRRRRRRAVARADSGRCRGPRPGLSCLPPGSREWRACGRSSSVSRPVLRQGGPGRRALPAHRPGRRSFHHREGSSGRTGLRAGTP